MICYPELENFLDSFLEMGVPGYDCLIKRHGETVFRRFNGCSDRENAIPMNGKELFNIYSCSKVITCCAALQLLEQGKFKLTDRLADYMPEFEHMNCVNGSEIVPAKNPITVWNLFTMTSGFTYDCNSPSLQQAKKDTDGKCPTRATMTYFAREPLSFEPSAGFQYSLSHDVLAALVEVITGMKFEDYVQKNIFAPLGIKNSTFLLPAEKVEQVAAQYQYDWEQKKSVRISKEISPYKLGSEYASGGAGCVSTTEDYSVFLEAVKDGKLISPETVALWSTSQLNAEQMKGFWVEHYGYGLGVRCSIDPNDKLHTDFGWGGAAGAFAVIDLKHDYTLSYMQHVLGSPDHQLRYHLCEMLAEYFDKEK